MDVDSNPLRLNGNCPSCGTRLHFAEHPDICLIEGATTDCNSCGTTLIIKEGRLYKLHEYLHAQDERWPADGKGTTSLTIA